MQRKGCSGDGDEVRETEVNTNSQWHGARKAQLQRGDPLAVTAAKEFGVA